MFSHNSYLRLGAVRDQLSENLKNQKSYYGNISQTYSFTLPIDFTRLK